MPGLFKKEADAIRRLRDLYPREPQKTLAKRIRSRDHFVGEELILANQVTARQFYSTYSVIRRHDAAKRAAEAQGKAA